MSTTVTKILTYFLIQSYLLKRSIMPTPLMFPREIYEFFRSTHRGSFMEKTVPRNFAIFTEKL